MTIKTHTFDYHAEPEGSFLKWAMVTFPGTSKDSSAFIEELSDRSDSFQNIELKIELNGMEVDAKAFMERLDQAMDWAIDRAVKEKFASMTGFDELHSAVQEFERGFKRRVRKLAEENGIEMDSDERYW